MRFKLAFAATLALSTPTAFAQFYATGGDSIHTDAVPGEYFFGVGVEAIKHDDYTHAVAMYKVAASWGYKPAEYNLGVIFAKGEGDVPLDLPQAYAWLVLAAERNDKQYVAARERVKSALSTRQIEEGDKILVDMRAIYGDEVALPRAKARWHDVLSHATGSHVGFTGSNMRAGAGGNFRSNPTDMPGMRKGGSPNVGAGDILGGNSVDGSIAYSDLRATDNPYDPRFNGTVTVGAIKEVDKKEKSADKPTTQSAAGN
jgi:hypothetical protein